MGKRGPQPGHGGRPRTNKPKPRDDGYKRVTVGPVGQGQQEYEHRAVEGLPPDSGSQAGNKPGEVVVDHKNRKRADNRPSNLRKVSKKKNRANSSEK